MLKIDGDVFRDSKGRQVRVRGLNFSSESKFPAIPDLPSHERHTFFDGDNVSFVGRPVPLDRADEHFARIKSWGYNAIRLLVTWEAIEHAGP